MRKLNPETKPGEKLFTLNNVLFVVILGILALRLSVNESIDSAISVFHGYSNIVGSLSLSAALIMCFMIWLVASAFKRKIRFYYSATELGFVLFTMAAVVGMFIASNKRSAMNHGFTAATAVSCAIIIRQFLDKPYKIKLVIFVLAAIACTNAVECFVQNSSSNKTMIEDYEANPQQHLKTLNIEPGSLAQWQYEHRLFSKDIKGYFKTSNSVSTFFLLCIFSLAGFIAAQLRASKKGLSENLTANSLAILILFLLIASLAITFSKGAIGAAVLGGALFIFLAAFGKTVSKHKIVFALLCVIGFVSTAALIISYGNEHGRLPGGNSMLVRWQYWISSWPIFKEDWMFGTCGGNFATAYLKHKIPAAIETVSDPHNFILSLATQYGIVGLIGFVLCIAGVFAKSSIITVKQASDSAASSSLSKFAITAGIVIAIILVMFRPLFLPVEMSNDSAVNLYLVMVMYVGPAAIFFLAMWLLSKVEIKFSQDKVFNIGIVCGIAAVLIHNLIDFAIFEPGVLTALFVLLACLKAQSDLDQKAEPLEIDCNKKTIAIVIFACLLEVGFDYGVVLIPVARASYYLKRVYEGKGNIEINLSKAYGIINPETALLRGNYYLQGLNPKNPRLEEYVSKARRIFESIAFARDPANYIGFDRLRAVESFTASQIPNATKRNKTLQDALKHSKESIKRYPGKAELWFEQGKILEKLNRNKEAIESYQKAVEIEDAYRDQFHEMYPDVEEVVSRMDKKEYEFAKQKIKELSIEK